jgi:hypothetical protein
VAAEFRQPLPQNFDLAKAKVIHSKYYKHLKKSACQKKWLVSGRLASKSSKTEILNKIGI